MSLLRGLGALSRAHLTEMTRRFTAVFWTLIFPMVWLVLALQVFGKGTQAGARQFLPGVFSMTLLGGAFFTVTFRMVADRQSGLLRRFRATPVSALAVVLAHGTTAVVSISLSFVLQAALAAIIWKATPVGSPLALAVILACGILAFVPLGLLVGSAARDQRSAPALTHLIFFPMIFLTGTTVPLDKLGAWARIPARVLPATWLNEALLAVMVRGDGLATLGAPIAVLLLTAVVGAVMNALIFRWESTEPVNGRRILLAIGLLVLLYGGAALLGPELASLPATPAALAPTSPAR